MSASLLVALIVLIAFCQGLIIIAISRKGYKDGKRHGFVRGLRARSYSESEIAKALEWFEENQ